MPAKLPVVQLENCLVRPVSDAVQQTLFANPLNLALRPSQRWAVTGPRKSDLLSVLAGRHIPVPPLSRAYPFLEKTVWPSQAIQFLQFKGSIPVSHLSARYEHFRDALDESLDAFLARSEPSPDAIDSVKHMLRLDGLGDRWIVGLSNGQMRRARLARALLKAPRLLLIDDPYLGLDPSSRQTLSDVLELMPPNPHVVLGLRYQDRFPDWITHVAITDAHGILKQGPVHEVEHVLKALRKQEHDRVQATMKSHALRKSSGGPTAPKDVILHIDNISIAYNGQAVLKDLSWTVRRGEKWHLRGDNGTGKSTLLALITADHPQSWNSKIVLHGAPRKTGRHSYFSINERIGHAAPEIHALFPAHRTAFDAVATGYVVGSMAAPPALSPAQRQHVHALLAEFQLDPRAVFGGLSLSDQKTVLFLRSVVKRPDLLILDEAFSGMDAWRVEQCKDFLADWAGTVISVGHIDDELPRCDKYLRLLPDAAPPVHGDIDYPLHHRHL